MKDSAPGDDELIIGCLRAAGEIGKEQVVQIIQRLCITDPHEGEPILHQVTGFRLYKKGDMSDMKSWRTLWLINTIERLLGRILSSRLQGHGEEYDIFGDTQFGFRGKHSTL